MDDILKSATVVLIGVGIAAFVNNWMRKQAALRHYAQMANPLCGDTLCGPLPMETSNCAIPLASDYLDQAQPYVPAVSPMNMRKPVSCAPLSSRLLPAALVTQTPARIGAPFATVPNDALCKPRGTGNLYPSGYCCCTTCLATTP